ncbi:MAG: glycosyl hydrolase [Caldilineaceae bacterium]|nr:glycosyl hydrolase [Caldilineaceae bacterium]
MTTQLDQSFLQALNWRCIGPPRGGRVITVAGHPTERMTFYFGAVGGGVWKTTDGGVYWQNITDGYFTSAAVGAIAVSESDPNVIYAGTGEPTIRGDVSYGDGVYKTTDGGKTWTNVGLADTHHISQIRIHPNNPDLVYVAAMGHAFGPNAERGVFRSKDGGATWEKVLYKSDKAGAADLTMDATNPRILYASIYEQVRNFWSLTSGGPDSGIWKSTDGGDTWTELTDNKGLPTGLKGKIGLAVSPAKPERVWAIIEAEDKKAGVYRSDDSGATWTQLTSNRDLIQRPWYYCHIFADPQDAETVYISNLKVWKSTDGGTNYTEITTPHGDNHGIWIDPNDTQRMINGNDGGGCVSFNGGATWSTIYNQMTSQFYHLDVDNQFPYHVYATQQDNSSIAVPSATEKGGIPWGDCYPAGTGESGYIAVNPDDPNIVFVGAVGSSPGGGGALQRYDHRTKQIRLVTVWPEAYTGLGAESMKYRFPWTFPILFSPHDSGVLYTCGNHVFRTTDEGSSWETISPDLTRNDPEKLVPSGGPLTLDTSGAEHYCTIASFIESQHEKGVFWAGSDDGLLHISRDGGDTWANVTPADLPEWSFITAIEQSPHDAATVYVSATRLKLDDYNPYLFKTTDYGESWERIDGSFPTYQGRAQITRIIREDPTVAGLLYAGTETGLYFSLDDGRSWQRMAGDHTAGSGRPLPVAPVYDLKIKGADLVVATHGRSFWILDDITPLRKAAAIQNAKVALFPPRKTERLTLGWSVNMFRGPGKNYMMGLGSAITFTEGKGEHGEQKRIMLDAGENPPQGVIIYYWLSEQPSDPIALTILDSDNNEIKRFTSKPVDARASEPTQNGKADKEEDPNAILPAKAGLNRFVWDMRYPEATKVPGDLTTEGSIGATGPRASTGDYVVQLTVGDETETECFNISADPRVNVSQEDMDAQFQLWQQIRDKVDETHKGINKLRKIRKQLDMWTEQAAENDQITSAANAIKEKLTAIEDELIQTKAATSGDRLRMPSKLNTKLIGLISIVAAADAKPTKQAYDVYGHLGGQIDEQLALLDGIIGDDLAAFNDLVLSANVTPVSV